MTFSEAINVLAVRDEDQIDEARHIVAITVADIVENKRGHIISDVSDFCQWLENGDYVGNETAEQIADEWLS